MAKLLFVPGTVNDGILCVPFANQIRHLSFKSSLFAVNEFDDQIRSGQTDSSQSHLGQGFLFNLIHVGHNLDHQQGSRHRGFCLLPFAMTGAVSL